MSSMNMELVSFWVLKGSRRTVKDSWVRILVLYLHKYTSALLSLIVKRESDVMIRWS